MESPLSPDDLRVKYREAYKEGNVQKAYEYAKKLAFLTDKFSIYERDHLLFVIQKSCAPFEHPLRKARVLKTPITEIANHKEMESHLKDVLELADYIMLKFPLDSESKILFLKTRVLGLKLLTEMNAEWGPKALEAFEEAIDFANKELKFTDLHRFNLAQSYSMFCYEVLKDDKKACNFAYSFLDEAIGQSDLIEKSENKQEIVGTVYWMRENFVTWINNMAWDDEDDGFFILIIPKELEEEMKREISWKKMFDEINEASRHNEDDDDEDHCF